MVTTVSGKKVPASHCKFIKNQYYEVGDPTVENSGDCYKVDGLYRRYNSGYIAYDHNKRQYVLVHKTTLRTGVIGKGELGKVEEGLFSPDPTENVVIVENGSSKLCINEKVAISAGFTEHYASGRFYPSADHNISWFRKKGNTIVNKNNLDYDSRYASNITQEIYDERYRPVMDNYMINTIGKWFDNNGITFGVEFETSGGHIPERICYKYGIIPLRDGSINGIEYVTVPLSGAKGLYALRSICENLQKRTSYDYKCALHIHLGGLSRTENSILSSYILATLVQDEQFLLQPDYKKGNVEDRKSYCGLLKSVFQKPEIGTVKSAFKKLFYFISDSREYSNYDNDLSKVDIHPSDPSGRHKWYISSRYNWINLVPIVFGNKKTIEFRHNTSSHKFEKVLSMLLSSALFVWTAENLKDDILNHESTFVKMLRKKPHSATEILVRYFKKHSGNKDMFKHFDLNVEYVKKRKEIMKEIKEMSDTYGKTESKHDKQYDLIFGSIYK